MTNNQPSGVPGVEAIENVADQVTSVAGRVMDFFEQYIFAGLTTASAFYQLGAVVAAVLISYGVSSYFGAGLKAMRLKLTQDNWSHRIRRVLLKLVEAVLFSFTAASLLAVCEWVLLSLGLVGAGSDMLILRLAYQIFYAWAILYVLMMVLTTLLGEKYIGPNQRKFVATVFWIGAALQIVGLLPRAVHLMKTYTLPIGSDNLTVWTLLVGVITVLFTMGVASKLADIAERQIMGMKELEMNLRVVFARICRVVLILLGVLIALSTVGIDLTVLSVFGGALGVGIGFGMQKIASNYISGFIILFDRSVKLGDLVEVAGFSGVVTQINTRYSVLRNLAGEELIVPNENFVTGTVKNYSLSDSNCVVNVETSCAYEADVDRALAVMLECVKSQPRVEKSRAPWAVVSRFGASGVNLKAGFWVSDPEKGTGTLKSDIMRLILKRFNEENIEIPYDKLDLTVKNTVQVKKTA